MSELNVTTGRLTDEMKAKRAEYLDGLLTHRQYYAWLADRIRLTKETRLLAHLRDGILASSDPHLNDVPLAKWDALHQSVLASARSHSGGPFAWSLSDSVCVLKELANQMRDDSPAQAVRS